MSNKSTKSSDTTKLSQKELKNVNGGAAPSESKTQSMDCPSCKSEDSLELKNGYLVCSRCGYTKKSYIKLE